MEGRAIGSRGGFDLVVQGNKWGAVSVLDGDEKRQGNHRGRAALHDAGGEGPEKERCRVTGALGTGKHRRRGEVQVGYGRDMGGNGL